MVVVVQDEPESLEILSHSYATPGNCVITRTSVLAFKSRLALRESLKGHGINYILQCQCIYRICVEIQGLLVIEPSHSELK